MAKLLEFLDDACKGLWAIIRMDDGDTCWITVSQTGVSLRKSTIKLFGSKLYEEKNRYAVVKTAETLGLLYENDLTPAEMQTPVLKSFTNAILHCRSLTEAVTLLDEVSDYLQGRTRDVYFVRNFLSLSDKIRADNGLTTSGNIEEAAVSVTGHVVTRALLETGRSSGTSPKDYPGAVSGALLICLVSSPLIMRLRQEGFSLSFDDITRKAALSILHLYEEDEAVRVIAEGTRLFKALIASGDEIQDIREFSDSTKQLFYAYVLSGNEKYVWILGRLYAAFLDAHACFIQKQGESIVRNIGKRRYKRFSVEEMDIHAKTLFAEGIDLLNISLSGACILSTKSLKFGDKYLIRLKSEGLHLALPGVVVWESLCSRVKNSAGEFVPAYKAGLAFKGITSDKLVELKDFIRVSGIPNEQRLSDEYKPSALRFTVHAHEKAVLFYPETAPVRKVSLGGMLVESSDRVQVEKKFPMALFLPNDALPVRFKGRVASCVPIPNERSKRFGIGVEFLDMAEHDRSRMGRFLGLFERRSGDFLTASKETGKENDNS
jgi:Tfp pilus assembly protein PilZ